MATRSRDERVGDAPRRPSRRVTKAWGRRKARRVAFVLSGGGNLGALQVGMLRALVDHGVAPDLLVGCSVGAINGAGFADDPTPAGVAHMEEVWRAIEGENLMPSGWLPNAVALARRGEAIHDHTGLRAMAEEYLRSRTFDELALPFQCVATDVAGVREVWFDSGELVPALLASAALPAVYPAVEIDGVRYLDGGIVDDVPVSRAVELGADTIYVLQVGSFTRPRPEPRRPLDVAIQSYWIARHYRFKRDLVNMPEGVEVHVLPAGDRPRMRFNDFTHTGTLIDVAYAATSAYLADRAAGLPAPSVEEALSQVQSSYEPPEAAEGEPTPAEVTDSRWRRTVAAARRRDRGDGGAGDAPVARPEVPDGQGRAVPEGAEVAGAAGGLRDPGPGDGSRPAAVAIKEDPSMWRRAVGIARRERAGPTGHAAGSDPAGGADPADATSAADPADATASAAATAAGSDPAAGSGPPDGLAAAGPGPTDEPGLAAAPGPANPPGPTDPPEPAEPGPDEPVPLETTSGLSAAHAVGARVARILSRGDA